VGLDAPILLAGVPESAFGPDSVFDRLYRRDALILFFNCTFSSSCTFVHYIEQKHGVDYRYEKLFHGPVVENGQTRETQASFFARDLDRGVVNDFDRFSDRLEADGLLQTRPLGSGKIRGIGMQKLFEAGFRALDEEPYIFLAHPPHSGVAAPG
jgi:aminoglycoside N3'-acetyltransferase